MKTISVDLGRRMLQALLAVLLAMAVPLAWAAEQAGAENSIQSIDYSALQGGGVLVKIGLKRPIQSVPAGFTINNPPRIVLDFPNTANGLGKKTIAVDGGMLYSMDVVQAGNRTRLVLNLARPGSYETRIDKGQLLLTLRASESAASTTNVTTRFAQATPGEQKHSLRDVDFRRGKSGEGRIVVDLSDTNTGIDIRKEGKTLVVDFINTALPANLQRRLDVTDFGTPVQTIDTYRLGDNVHMVIQPKGQWEHSAYQADRRFILEVKPVAEEARLGPGEKPRYTGQKLSLNFQNVEVRSVLQVIADFTGLNIITSDSVTGNLTLRLKDVPWDQALDIILQAKGLSKRQEGNVIWIAPTDELATREKLELEAKQQISELEPVRTESFQLNYQKADAVQKILSDPKQKILSKRGSVVIDERTNTLFVQDTPTKLEEIHKLIAQIDVPVRQVLIESRIVEASDTFSKDLGARLGVNDAAGQGFPIGPGSGTRTLIGGQLEATQARTGQLTSTTTPTLSNALNVNLPAANVGGFPASALSLILFKAGGTRFLNMEISALQADGKGKILSNPRIVTADQQEATIEQGTEIPYQQATSSGATSVNFKKAVLSLKVKPQITPDDNIIMDLQVNKDTPDYQHITAGVPPLLTKNLKTQVLVENGGTVVIGGIYSQTQNETVTKVPLLGDIPVLGNLFKNRASQNDKTELLIFVTPKILKESLNIR